MTKKTTAKFPPLRAPAAEIADPGTVRLGDSSISGRFPTLRAPNAEIADPGHVRFGDSSITGHFARR